MANITKRTNSKGEVSYRIRVFKGKDQNGKQLKPYTMTYKPNEGISEKQIQKELNRQAVLFEEQCKTGAIIDNKQTFAEYAEYVLKLKERQGVKRTTLFGYHNMLRRINTAIGHIKITDIRPQHLNMFYEQISAEGIRADEAKAQAKCDLRNILSNQGLTQERLKTLSGVSINTVRQAVKGSRISASTAEKISQALGGTSKDFFDITKNKTPLSSKSIVEHHRLISTILAQADKEMLIPFNPALKASPPKVETKEVNYYDINTVEQIRDALVDEPIKWQLMIHLLLITGARRGELAGLKWGDIDFYNNRVHIQRNLIYVPGEGLYVDTLKTKKSERYVSLPHETIDLIHTYRAWYLRRKLAYGNRWHDTDYLFFQERSGNEGLPMHPDSTNSYLERFEQRKKLPHLNPHAFRHTHVSILYFNKVDPVTISSRVGHSKTSTTTDIYAHLMPEANERASECAADIILRPKKTDNKNIG